MRNPFDHYPEKPEFMSITQQEAYSRLLHAVEASTLGVLTGEVGSGKSTLLRVLATTLPTTEYQIIYLCSAGLTPKELYGGILKAMGESPAFSLSKVKQQWQEVWETRTAGTPRKLLVMIDEAHDLPTNTLLELRFLMSHGMEPEPPFAVLLAGQAQLRSTLRKNLFEPISQRIRMQYHLAGMTVEECSCYIEERMKTFSLERPVFTEDAKRLIHATSQGIPRIINLLCGHALYAAQKREENAVEEKTVKSVIADLERQRGDR